jgi:hypothetical protein
MIAVRKTVFATPKGVRSGNTVKLGQIKARSVPKSACADDEARKLTQLLRFFKPEAHGPRFISADE